MNSINKLKLAIPKKGLFFIAAFVWGFAAYRILEIGFFDVINNTKSYWIHVAVGFIGCYFFFKYVFIRVFRRNTQRIINAQNDRLPWYSFFDTKGFITMAFMITLGITLRWIAIIPSLYLGTFYITLGLSLLLGAVCFMFVGIKFEKIKNKYLTVGN